MASCSTDGFCCAQHLQTFVFVHVCLCGRDIQLTYLVFSFRWAVKSYFQWIPMRCLSRICVCVCARRRWKVQGLPSLSLSVRGKINLPASHLTPSACYAADHHWYLCVRACVCTCLLSSCQPFFVSPSLHLPVVLLVCPSPCHLPAVSFVSCLPVSDLLLSTLNLSAHDVKCWRMNYTLHHWFAFSFPPSVIPHSDSWLLTALVSLLCTRSPSDHLYASFMSHHHQ